MPTETALGLQAQRMDAYDAHHESRDHRAMPRNKIVDHQLRNSERPQDNVYETRYFQ